MLTGYHTVEDRDNPDEIEADGPFKCSRRDAWLGPGYYFWDSRIAWAHKWGKDAYERKGNNYVICQAELDNSPSIMLDLFGNVLHQEEFLQAYQLLKSRLGNSDEYPLVSEILHFLHQQNLLPYKSVRAHDEWNQTYEIDFQKGKGFTTIGQRVQICLFEKNDVTLRNFYIVFPDHYCQSL